MMMMMIMAMKCIKAVKTHVGLNPQIVAVERCEKYISIQRPLNVT